MIGVVKLVHLERVCLLRRRRLGVGDVCSPLFARRFRLLLLLDAGCDGLVER